MQVKKIEKLIDRCAKIVDDDFSIKNTEGKNKLKEYFDQLKAQIKDYEKELKTIRKKLKAKEKIVREVKESMEELLSIQKLSQTIRFAKNPEDIYSTLVELSKKVVPIELSGIFLFDKETNEISSLGVKTVHKKLEKDIERFLEEGIVDWVIDEKKTIVIPDIETVSNENIEGLKRNFVFIPLITKGEGRGIFLIYTPKEEKTFTGQNLELLTILTEQAAIAIENYVVKEKLNEYQKRECSKTKEGKVLVKDEI